MKPRAVEEKYFLRSGPKKKHALPKISTLANSVETKDVCIGTSVGTITEPEYLRPCEPGTHVTLGGIVWHETNEGVLVVSITWRGKTYSGSLIDCTEHNWAPPRWGHSPMREEPETPRGRGERSQPIPPSPQLNAAETRSGKLPNANKGSLDLNSNTLPSTPENSPMSDNSSLKRKFDENEESVADTKPYKKPRATTNKNSSCSSSGPSSPASDIGTPVTMDHENTPVSTAPKHPTSPYLIPCDKPNCSKKFTNIRALQYHQTSAHKNIANIENWIPDNSSVVRSFSMEYQADDGAVPEAKQSIGMSNLAGSPLQNRTPILFRHLTRSSRSPTCLGDNGDDDNKTVLVGPGGTPALNQTDKSSCHKSLMVVLKALDLSDLPGAPNNKE